MEHYISTIVGVLAICLSIVGLLRSERNDKRSARRDELIDLRALVDKQETTIKALRDQVDLMSRERVTFTDDIIRLQRKLEECQQRLPK